MSFVNPGVLGLRRVRMFELIFDLFWRVPETPIVDGRLAEVLGHASDPGRDTLNSFIGR
jgi:hypothetical protein